MRIIGGLYKGRKILPSNLKFTRPTTDFAREGLFNLLYSRIELQGISVLDLYSGSGAIAIEFLSRGARSAIAIDSNLQSVRFISETKLKWNVENLEVVKAEALRYLDRCSISFDIIFADPPFDTGDYEEILKTVFDRHLLASGGRLILEHEKKGIFEGHPYFEFQRSYGSINFSIFRQESDLK